MSRTKWHGLEQRKANYRTREWVKSLSDADAKRMNIDKEKAIKNLNNRLSDSKPH